MSVRIFPIPLGFDCCYLLQGQGVILIDAGSPNKQHKFLKQIARLPISVRDIQLIVITHGHFDHVGSARAIQEATGARIAMHQEDRASLEKGTMVPPPGVNTWGRFLAGMIRPLLPRIRIDTCEVDLVVEDEGLSLREYGIAGKIVHTPGHSMGSISVVLDSGEAFVGDLAMNRFPLCLRPSLPILAQDLERVRESWRVLLTAGTKTVFPAHGKPFPIESLSHRLPGI